VAANLFGFLRCTHAPFVHKASVFVAVQGNSIQALLIETVALVCTQGAEEKQLSRHCMYASAQFSREEDFVALQAQ
jgi:hypothetical protein